MSIIARLLNAKAAIVIAVSVTLNIFFILASLRPTIEPLYHEIQKRAIQELGTGLFPAKVDTDESSWQFNKKGDDVKPVGNHILAVAVMSSPGNVERRTNIRKTWKNGYQNRDHHVKFVLGTKNLDSELVQGLENENSEHQDLVLLSDIIDSYHNLPHKVLSTLIWFDHNEHYLYLLKCDDDTFPLLDRMEDDLQKRDHTHGLYWGYFIPNTAPLRTGKWADPHWKFCDNYFPYAVGGGYILSADVVHRIASNADALIVYNNEDVSVGAWTVSYDIERKHDVRFDCQAFSRGCQNTFLIFHFGKQTLEETTRKDKLIRETGTLCEQEYLDDEYQYYWSELPRHAYKHTCRWIWYKYMLWGVSGTIIVIVAAWFVKSCVGRIWPKNKG